MPTYRVSVINQTFRACNEHDVQSLDDAREQGIKSALEIGAGEVARGKSFFGAEVRVEKGGELLGRYVVSAGFSPLQDPSPDASG
ncbi:MAG TPA: hypothetical protein VFS69_01095 [Sphingomicrobium sp.]|nr:hypothetical protein [Sphingomicrobium sp.]